MRKTYLIFILLVLASCQRDEEEPAQSPYASKIEELHDYLSARLYAKAQSAKFEPLPPVYAKIAASEPVNSHLTRQQLTIAEPFLKYLWNMETTAGLSATVDDFEAKVLRSNLSESEKWELITIGESVRVTGEFIDNDGLSIVYDKIAGNLRTSGPPKSKGGGGSGDPCIEVKEIMQGAVLSGLVGAGVGGFYGATVGTFTIPVVGTATGAVGGAVFGFAEGFFGGVVGGAAQQIIFDCLLERDNGGYQVTFDDGSTFTVPRDLKFADNLVLHPK